MLTNNQFEEFLPTPLNNSHHECYSCRRSENSDRMKLDEHSNQIAALKKEEIQLKSLHRRLELRIKQFQHRTRNTILIEEKLIKLEKSSQNELLKHPNLNSSKKSSKEKESLLKNIQQIEENNRNFQNNIDILCQKIKQLEKESEDNYHKRKNQNTNHTKTIDKHEDDQLHRMNLQLNKINIDNSQLRLEIKQILDKRSELIDEYNHLNTEMKTLTTESRQLTSECSKNFVNRRNLVAHMRVMEDQHEIDEKKFLENIRELDRLLEINYVSKHFLIKKSNIREEQIQLNERFAGERSEGNQCAYTGKEFRRLFKHYFHQNFTKEKLLNQTVETFLNQQDQSFALFEYLVELINELHHQRQILENKRTYISTIFSTDHLDSFIIKDKFSTLEQSVNEMTVNVDSLELAKKNLRQILDRAYDIILNLFNELDCDRSFVFLSNESIHDRNILLYLASIESYVQQLLLKKNVNRKLRANLSSTDETTISWRIDHQSLQSLTKDFIMKDQKFIENLQEIDSITPQIALTEQIQENIEPEQVVNKVLDVYNERVRTSTDRCRDHSTS